MSSLRDAVSLLTSRLWTLLVLAGPFSALAWTGAVVAGGSPATVDAFLAEADDGLCIEDVVYRRIESGSGDAAMLVQAATRALEKRAEQQRELGCDGDIATQAIAAGADPQIVLEATAAGL